MLRIIIEKIIKKTSGISVKSDPFFENFNNQKNNLNKIENQESLDTFYTCIIKRNKKKKKKRRVKSRLVPFYKKHTIILFNNFII